MDYPDYIIFRIILYYVYCRTLAWDELLELSFPSMSAASSLQLDPRWSCVWRGAMAFPSLPTLPFRAKPVQKSRPSRAKVRPLASTKSKTGGGLTFASYGTLYYQRC